uniref:Dendritic cell-specific transmembrane protein-like domain-containing protein n=1 Tax=Globodera rostochiensis TaxID=31243 RepID=A0A914I013_GLORO
MTTAVLWEFYMAKRTAVANAKKFEDKTTKLRKRRGLLPDDGTGRVDVSDGEQTPLRQRIATREGRQKLLKQIKEMKNRRPKDSKVRSLLTFILVFFIMQIVNILYFHFIALKFPGFAELGGGNYLSMAVQFLLLLLIVFRPLRFVLFVALPSLLTGRLRSIIVLMMIIWGFQFPAKNVTNNIDSVMEGVGCVVVHIKEAAQEIKQRAGHKLYEEPVAKMREFLHEQAKPFDGIRASLREMDESLTKMMAWQRALAARINGMMSNCTHIAQLPFKACIGWLTERHTDCLNRFLEFLCAPVDWAKQLCYLTKMLQFHCDWPSAVKNTVKEGVGYFVKGAKKGITDYAKSTFMYDLVNKTTHLGKETFQTLDILVEHNVNETDGIAFEKDSIQRELKDRVKLFNRISNAIVWTLDLLMLFTTIWPFLSAILYIRAFVRSDDADNRFIGKDFKQIDDARALSNQQTVLPLLPKERKTYIRATTVHMTRRENVSLCISNLFLLYSMVPILVFIAVDVFVYRLINRTFVFFHGNATIFPRPNIYALKVSGDGFLNQMLANILHTFEPINDDARDQLWRRCFKEPSRPNYELFQTIFYLYLFCVLLINVGVYLARVRHFVALYYLPERAYPRAINLYTKIMEGRKDMFDLVMNIRQSTTNEENVGEHERQLLFKGLSVITEEKLRCYRCSRVDLSIAESSKVRICAQCGSVYCLDCFTIRKNCLRKECRASLQAITEDVDLYVDSSCEEDESSDEAETVDVGGKGVTSIVSTVSAFNDYRHAPDHDYD